MKELLLFMHTLLRKETIWQDGVITEMNIHVHYKWRDWWVDKNVQASNINTQYGSG